MFSQDTISIIFNTSKLDFLNQVVVPQKTKASSFRGVCMYVKRIRKIKNYKKRVVILKIVKDMDTFLSPPWRGTPLNVSTDQPR